MYIMRHALDSVSLPLVEIDQQWSITLRFIFHNFLEVTDRRIDEIIRCGAANLFIYAKR